MPSYHGPRSFRHVDTTGRTVDDHHAQLHAAEHEPGGGDPGTVDAAVDVGSRRTLGLGAAQAKPGDADPAHVDTTGQTVDDHHAQLHAAEHEPGGGDPGTVDAAVDVGSRRTLGLGAAQAKPGDADPAHADTTGRTTDDHHAQTHTLTSHSTKAHGELTDVTANQHHARLHADAHANGGDDELNVGGLSGLLADDQHVLDAEVLTVAAALVHAARHQNGGADKISVAGLSGLLADDQHVLDAEVTAAVAASVYGQRSVCLVLFESDEPVEVLDGTVGFAVPAALNLMILIAAVATVHDKGVTGTTDVQVRRRRAGANADMLSTKITIGDEFYAADGVVNAATDDLATGDIIYSDVDAVHTTPPNGLSVVLTFATP